MTDELQKALNEAKANHSPSLLTNYEIRLSKYEHFATLALAELERKDERIRELETKLEAIKDALPSDEQLLKEIWGGNKHEPFHNPENRIKANAYEKGITELRTRIQNILDK